jgi:hypothetical protein
MTFDHVYESFQVASQQRDDDGLLQYVQLSAVHRAAPAQLQQLLLLVLEMLSAAVSDRDARADLSASSIEVCLAVLKFKPAQQLDSDMIKSLLEASFSIAHQASESADGIQLTSVWVALCQLPQAANLDQASIINLLEMSLSRSAARFGHSGTAALCSLLEQKSVQAGWEGLTCQQAEQLLARAVPTSNGGSIPGLKELCSLECVQRAIDNSAAMRLLGSALAFGKLKACRDPAAATEQLLWLPATASIPSLDLVQLTTCVQHCRNSDVKRQLLELLLSRGSLPGPDELESLITMCLQETADKCAAACIQLLCEDPAAQQISVSTALLLVLQAVDVQQPQSVSALAHGLSAGIGHLSSEQVAQLLLAAGNAALDAMPTASKGLAKPEQEHWLDAVCAVISIPAVHGVDADVVAQLLANATRKGAVQYLEQLLGILSQQQLKEYDVGPLLHLAAQQQQHACVRLLAGLPGAAASLSAQQIMQLLQESVQKDDHEMAVILCGVQTRQDFAQTLKPHHVKQLLTAALRHGKSLESVFPLCTLPAAGKLPTADINLLIKAAEKASEGERKAVERTAAAAADSCARKMKKSTPYNDYSPNKAARVLSPSQVARQTVAAVTGSVQSEYWGSARVQLGMRVVATLKDVHAAACKP